MWNQPRTHCVKNVRIWSFSGSYFPTFWLDTERYGVSLRIQSEWRENTDQKNSEYEHFSRSDGGDKFYTKKILLLTTEQLKLHWCSVSPVLLYIIFVIISYLFV